MPLPRPRETLESSNNIPPFGWIVGLVVLFAPAAATIAWFVKIARRWR